MPQSTLEAAREMMDQGRWEDAEASLGRLLAAEPANPLAAYFRAQCLANLDRFDEAVALYDLLLVQVASDPVMRADVHVSRGIALVDSNRLDEADRAFDEALRIKPRLARVWVHKARAAARRKDFAGSIECCDRALALDSADYRAWNNKAFGLLQLGRLDECIRAAESAVKLKPDYTQAFMWLAQAYERKGQAERAQQYLSRAMGLIQSRPDGFVMEQTVGHRPVPPPKKKGRWWSLGKG